MNKVEIFVIFIVVCLMAIICIYYWGNDLFMTLFILLIGIFAGGLITLLTAMHFYLKASKELKSEVEKMMKETEKIKKFNDMGLNVKFEKVTTRSNDNSMSNCIVLYKNHTKYINIETEHGDLSTQKKMIDRVMKILGERSI